jgi:hypothetical protein
MNAMVPPEVLQQRIHRLVKLQGSDPGFYILAVHAFIECFLREYFNRFEKNYYLKDLLWDFREHLQRSIPVFLKNFNALNEIARNHDITNEVRHAFRNLSAEEARAATLRFLAFCDFAGIGHLKELGTLKESLKLWDDRSTKFDVINEMNRLGFELVGLRKRNSSLEAELSEVQHSREKLSALENSLRGIEEAYENEKTAKQRQDSRIDELRRERSLLFEEKRSLAEKLQKLNTANEYILNMNRMSLYTRSRMDYERELVRLTREQKNILDEITLGGDFLVKGGAGTGKTLVLLSALEKLLKSGKEELDLGNPEPRFALLTFSDTLVKYDRYIASILTKEDREAKILSVDEYIARKLRALHPGFIIDQEFYRESVREACRDRDVAPGGIETEIEDFIIANDVSEKEYCIDGIERTGMKRRLSGEQRVAVWKIFTRVARSMEEAGRVSKNYSRLVLARAADGAAEPKEDYLFIDEVQDLVPADLKALRALTRGAIIMAGDNDQAIFRKGFSFKRAGIDIVGKSRTIKLNFRNTLQINELAERFRRRYVLGDEEPEKKAYERPCDAFRPGPPPELFLAPDVEGLQKALLERTGILTRLLGYEAENIVVVVPDIPAAEEIGRVFEENGIPAVSIAGENFSFASSPGLRVSTMHDVKGIDIPVVLLYLPEMPERNDSFDDVFNETLTGNLLYVSMTRAMEYLGVFTLSTCKNSALRDMVAVFRTIEKAAESNENV